MSMEASDGWSSEDLFARNGIAWGAVPIIEDVHFDLTTTGATLLK